MTVKDRKELKDQPVPAISGDESPVTESHLELEALKMVARRPWVRRIGWVVLAFVAVVIAGLWFIPWQQTVVGNGAVIVFEPNARPQTIEAQIPARIVDVLVQEGQMVEKGQPLMIIQDIEQRFLDPDLPKRLDTRVTQLEEGRDNELERVARLQAQISQVEASRVQQIENAKVSRDQAIRRKRVAQQNLKVAQNNLSIVSRVARNQVDIRDMQAEDAIKQAEQAVTQAKTKMEFDQIQRERIARLYAKGLSSKREDELSQNELVASTTAWERAKLALDIAKKSRNLTTLSVDQAELEIERTRAQVMAAQDAVAIADRDIQAASNNITRIDADTAATIASLEGTLQSAQSTVNKNNSDIESIKIDRANLQARRGQTSIVSPSRGRIVRLLKIGEGATVKSGDVIATIVPETQDRAVELMVSDNDVSFIRVGRKVRLQFAGWPALQFGGMPSVNIGTFGGVIQFIDPVDDGSSRFRVIVREDRHELLGGRMDQPWPDAAILRPGAEAVGWIMLDQVPLGFELWRQFNGFPPRLSEDRGDFRLPLSKSKSGEKGSDSDDKNKKSLSPDIKIKSQK